MIIEVYEAFIAAGVPGEAAKKATQALSSESLATKADMQKIEANQLLLKSMLGFNLAFTMAIVWKVFV